MDLSANLYITAKGVEEVKARANKLSMKKRSVLILLDTPKSLAQIIAKSVFPAAEIHQEIDALIDAGFIASDAVQAPLAAQETSGASLAVDDEIILSEAKFLLTDFVVDSFGTQSQAFVEAIRACHQVADFRSCLSAVLAAVEKKHPEQLSTLRRRVGEINATA